MRLHPENLLEVEGVVMIEDPASDDHAGVVIDDHNHESAARPPIFAYDVGQICRTGLPHLPEARHFKGPALPDNDIARLVHVLFLEETLDSADADHCRDEAVLD